MSVAGPSTLPNEHTGPANSPIEKAAQRFDILQVARGFSATWVVLFHIYMLGCVPILSEKLPQLLRFLLFDWGRGGVAVFFVLSGFVITHSFWEKPVDSRVAALFVLRRSIRLDPPYWVSIVFALSVVYASEWRHETESLTVSIPDIIYHILYLQDILHRQSIQSVYWTLAYEVQFYIVFICLIISYQKLKIILLRRLILASSYGVALIGACIPLEWAPHGLFLNYWYAFVAGCVAYYSGVKQKSVFYTLPLVITMMITASSTSEVFNTPAGIASIGLLMISRTNIILKKVKSKALMMLGSISYSLYLIHIPVINIVVSLSKGWNRSSALEDVVFLTLVFAVCLILSLLLWWFVERPAHSWSRSVGGLGSRKRV